MGEVDDPCGEWLGAVAGVDWVIDEIHLHPDDDVELDRSPRSLRQLEAHFVGWFDDPKWFAESFAVPGHPEWAGLWETDWRKSCPVELIAGYIGTMLADITGGDWEWAADLDRENFPYGVPLVVADAGLDLAPVSPAHLMLAALQVGDGERFVTQYQEWIDAVARKQREQPGWFPESERELHEWLRGRADAFPAWVAAYAPDGGWDFTPGSLPALAELVRRVAPTRKHLKEPANQDFADGAAWYYGEVICRTAGGVWTNGGIGTRSVVRPDRRSTDVGPAVVIRMAIDEPGNLRTFYDLFGTE